MPLTGERAQYELNREEKLAIYDHVCEVAHKTNPSNMISEQELLLLQDTKGKKTKSQRWLVLLKQCLSLVRNSLPRRRIILFSIMSSNGMSYLERSCTVLGNEMLCLINVAL